MFSVNRVKIALVGERDRGIKAHEAIPLALEMAAEALRVKVDFDWLATDRIGDGACLDAYDGIWCVPGSPYRDTQGALTAIRHAREGGIPFLGTCGGFQHALLEFARNSLGWQDAQHAELDPHAPNPLIGPLSCALVDVGGRVRLVSGTQIAELYGVLEITEEYLCRYGLDAAFREPLMAHSLRASGHDEAGEVRAIELQDHPFFLATLFQPERAALAGRLPPVVAGLVGACAVQAAHERKRAS
ncbi:CTP synthase [Pseudomonas sp. RIT-PI-AD]|uniref:CTP synthase C-terminal region-related (seleno)protein n=1 Tax=Pseudomonas sp. RIT-PI-AD TaxID=3035294 RepID=UPI0021D9AFE1|nr:CTP synthase [Pseudomonas sp. RIT-PI-AD]